MSTPKIRPSDYPFAGTPTATPRPALKATGMRRRYARCLETELAEAKAECERLKFATEGHLLKTIQQQAELAVERERVRVLKEALEQVGELVDQMLCVPISEESVVSAKAYGIIDAALAATKEEIK